MSLWGIVNGLTPRAIGWSGALTRTCSGRPSSRQPPGSHEVPIRLRNGLLPHEACNAIRPSPVADPPDDRLCGRRGRHRGGGGPTRSGRWWRRAPCPPGRRETGRPGGRRGRRPRVAWRGARRSPRRRRPGKPCGGPTPRTRRGPAAASRPASTAPSPAAAASLGPAVRPSAEAADTAAPRRNDLRATPHGLTTSRIGTSSRRGSIQRRGESGSNRRQAGCGAGLRTGAHIIAAGTHCKG